MKETLLRRELILDAADRTALTNELQRMGVDFAVDKHIVIPINGVSTQAIIGGLKTQLTYLNTHEPSLEDAYVELVSLK
jgi:ABC-2 type transport system ATP-binding protein